MQNLPTTSSLLVYKKEKVMFSMRFLVVNYDFYVNFHYFTCYFMDFGLIFVFRVLVWALGGRDGGL